MDTTRPENGQISTPIRCYEVPTGRPPTEEACGLSLRPERARGPNGGDDVTQFRMI